MAPSPRKRAPPTTTLAFDQTWDETDAALLNPDSLPLAKIPRAWERRQEVKKTGDGKAKKVWRRFNLRSRASETTQEQHDADPEEHDVRSRAVKRQQQISPKAMERTAAKINGKTRAFRATRWDRRKSVLPRKKSTRSGGSIVDTEDVSETEDSLQETSGYSLESVDESVISAGTATDNFQPIKPEDADRRATFTFTMDTPSAENELEHETTQVADLMEDATSTNLFRSPVKRTTRSPMQSAGTLSYPSLLQSPVAGVNAQPEHHNAKEEISQEVEHSTVNEMLPATNIGPQAQQAHYVESSGEDLENSRQESSAAMLEVEYPTLPKEIIATQMSPTDKDDEIDSPDVEMSEASDAETEATEEDNSDVPRDSIEACDEVMPEDDFTEATLQLDMQQQCEQEDPPIVHVPGSENPESIEAEPEHEEIVVNDTAPPRDPSVLRGADSSNAEDVNDESEQQDPDVSSISNPMDDITDGLTLFFTPAQSISTEPTTRKLHSPPPPPRMQSGPEDATMTLAFDDDTAILKDFLNRAAASKAEKAATHRRESIQNRRDSDIIRNALASPCKVLEDKDPNSPIKHDTELVLDLPQNLVLSIPAEELKSPSDDVRTEEISEDRTLNGSRRSSRTKKSRLPAPASAAPVQSSKIAIRRADGNEVVVLKKSDTQELATLTKSNTRKNKQGAFGVTVRLLKLAADAGNLPPIDDLTKELIVGKNVRWDEQLTYYQENPDTVAEAESLATPDELGMPDAKIVTLKVKKSDKNSTPKIRRVRGLGTVNGTPGKGLLAPAALLPDALHEEAEADKPSMQAPTQQLPRPKASKLKKMPVAPTTIDNSVSSNPADTTKLPSLDVTPVGVVPTPAAQRKSRLAAPKKVVLPQPTSSLPIAGKENTQRTGISDATPRKGIPAPRVVIPSAATAPAATVDSALPRRRGRKY